MGWLGIICGILAIIFAVVAKGKIKANPALSGSAGQAKTGLITGIIGIIIGVVIIIIAIMFVAAVANTVIETEGLQDLENALRDLENMQ